MNKSLKSVSASAGGGSHEPGIRAYVCAGDGQSVEIRRPGHEVSRMDDNHKGHQWQPYLLEWSQTPDPACTGVGSRRCNANRYMGRRFENVYEVTQYQPGTRVMYRRTPEAPVQAEGGATRESVPEGIWVTLHFRPMLGDFWGWIPKPIARWINGRTLLDNLKRLKARLEAGTT